MDHARLDKIFRANSGQISSVILDGKKDIEHQDSSKLINDKDTSLAHGLGIKTN